jgi:hypothetical protein
LTFCRFDLRLLSTFFCAYGVLASLQIVKEKEPAMADDPEKTIENGKKPYHSPEIGDELSEKEAEKVTGGLGPSPGHGGPSPGFGPSPGGPSPG